MISKSCKTSPLVEKLELKKYMSLVIIILIKLYT